MSEITEFETPRKEILSKEQLEQFQQSTTHSQILAFIQRLNDAVVGVKLTDTCNESDVRERFILVIWLLIDVLSPSQWKQY